MGRRQFTATYPGNGAGSSGGNVVFDPAEYNERSGLLEINGTIYTAWGSHCDAGAYTGIDETLLAKKLKELLEAKRPRWNLKKQAFDLFPDLRAPRAALRLIFEIRGSFRAERDDDQMPRIINLGGIPRYNDQALRS